MYFSPKKSSLTKSIESDPIESVGRRRMVAIGTKRTIGKCFIVGGWGDILQGKWGIWVRQDAAFHKELIFS